MFTKKSRYKNAKFFNTDTDGNEVFRGIRSRHIDTTIGLVEHEIKHDDRLDILARHYYNDDRLWWRIVDANPEILNGQVIMDDNMAGQVILIPKVKG